ncbi:MAG: shikimate dehydrogenase [Prevotellaceae bacterium]|jgi:shikimate dehydrogenase|nr:shikimate dehydrogenase [Prevotellaceae bacterium]
MKKFALVGKPIAHSKSPALFRAAYGDCSYEYSLIETADVKYVESLLRSNILCGVNVTIPIKMKILTVVDEMDETVEITGAANVIVIHADNKLKAYNTDYLGVLQTLTDFDVNVAGKECLVVGAGGAGRTVAFALHRLGAKITVANRTPDRAGSLVEKINCNVINIDEISDNLSNKKMIVNALPANINVIDEKYLNSQQIIFDASPRQSDLLTKAQSKGCKCIDGRFWLLHQGIAAYKIFTRQQPDVVSMRKILNL